MAESKVSVLINGESRHIPVGFTIRQLLVELEIQTSAIAVEINAEIHPQEKFESTILRQGDQIEIVSLVGGG